MIKMPQKKILFAILLIIGGIFILTLISNNARALTIIVDDDAQSGGDGSKEKPFNTIQDAINASDNGDIIYICEGNYGVGNVNKTLHINGENREKTFTSYMIFEGNGGNSITNLTIEHISIDNNCHNNFISNCNFLNFEVGIMIDESRNNTISNCTFENNERYGITAEETSGNTIEFCTFKNNGIFISCDTKEDYLSNDIKSNTVNGKALIVLKNMSGFTFQEIAGQIVLMNCSYGIIRNQKISSSDVGIHVIYSSNINIIDSSIINNNVLGIHIINSNNCIIDNCIIFGNGIGIFIEDSNTNTITNCNIFDNHWIGFGRGVYLSNSSNNLIGNSWIHDHHSKISYGIILSRSSNNNSIKMCEITNNTGKAGITYQASNDNSIMSCLISNNSYGILVMHESKRNSIISCNILDNEEFGIQITYNNEHMVNATNNWWGHVSGPYHPENNSQGKGDNITDLVEFEPWLKESIISITLYVSHSAPSGGNGSRESPFNKIQHAIDRAYAGWTIRIFSGTYNERIEINKPLKIIGNSSWSTIIDAWGASSVININADWVEISALGIHNASESGISLINSSGISLINCTIIDTPLDYSLSHSYIRTVNTLVNKVNFTDSDSLISVLWLVDLKVTDNRSGFIQDAHVGIIGTYVSTVFESYTDERGKVNAMIREYSLNFTARTDYNPYTISILKNGYLNFSEELNVTSYTSLTCQLQTHVLPQATISGELVQYMDMDSEIFFDGTQSTGRSITFHWELGDGNTSASPTTSHTYTVPGVYQVNLMVKDDYENISMASIIVIVKNVEPVIIADIEKNTAFEDEPILLDASFCWDTPSDSLSFNWDFGDGEQTDKSVASHSFQQEANYIVTLTITDRHGGKNTSTHYINVSNQAPWDVSAGEDISVYTKEILELKGSAKDTKSDYGRLTYSWDFGEGTKAVGQNVSHVYYESGVYKVNLTVTDNNGASGYAWVDVTVKDPEILVSVSSYQIFQDEKVTFNSSHELDDESFNFSWDFGDGTSAEGKNVSHIFNKAGIFTPWLIINDGLENITIFLPQITVQNVVPVPVIRVDNLQVEEDESVQFDASESLDSPSDLPILSYSWDFSNGSNSAGIEVTHAFSEIGDYTVTLTVSDGKTMSTTGVQIEVQNLPPVADAGKPSERKTTVGEPVILDATGTTDTPSDIVDLNYTWRIGNDTVYGKVVSYIFSKTGDFKVSIIVQDNNGATSEDTITYSVSKECKSDDAAMNTINWILMVVIVVFLVIIGFLLSVMRDEALHREMKAEEEAIVVEGEIDEDSFKPKNDVKEATVEVDEERDRMVTEAEIEVMEGESDDEMFKPKREDLESRVEVVERQEMEISGEDIDIVKESEIVSEEMDDVGTTEEKLDEIVK